MSVSMIPAAQTVSDEEEEKDEDEQSGHNDVEEDVDDINYPTLSKETVRANSPTQRPQTVDIWKHVRRITKHDVSDRGMKTECTHVCVYRLDDGEDGEKRYCNTSLKLFFRTRGTAGSHRFFPSKVCYTCNRTCRSSSSDCASGLE